MKLTEAEWRVMEALWAHEPAALGVLTEALKPINGWNKNTVHTYLTRMEKKGLVRIERMSEKPYRSAVSKESCAREERHELLSKVYGGAAGDLIAAFLKESPISKEEADRLRRMLDEM